MNAILNYRQWEANRRRELCDLEDMECPKCEGEGSFERECHCCGVESQVSCDVCPDSLGKIDWIDLPSKYQDKMLSKEAYEDALRGDISDVAIWINKAFHVVAFNYQLMPYSDLKRRKGVFFAFQ